MSQYAQHRLSHRGDSAQPFSLFSVVVTPRSDTTQRSKAEPVCIAFINGQRIDEGRLIRLRKSRLR